MVIFNHLLNSYKDDFSKYDLKFETVASVDYTLIYIFSVSFN